MGGDSLHCCYREQFAYALYAKFREPRLYRMADNGDWERIPARCHAHPREASFVHRYPPNDTPLHRLLRPLSSSSSSSSSSATAAAASSSSSCEESVFDRMEDEVAIQQMLRWKMEAVVAIVRAHPSCVRVRDSFGRNPLHLACMDVKGGGDLAAHHLLDVAAPTGSRNDGGGPATTAAAANHDPATTGTQQEQRQDPESKAAAASSSSSPSSCPACVMDVVERRTPLHYLVARNADAPLDLVRRLLRRHPHAAHARDVTGETPADIVRRRIHEMRGAGELLAELDAPA